MEKLIIKLNDWDYECGDGCCSMYGTEISLNGKKCENEYSGGDVKQSLEFILNELGYDVEIINTHED